MVTVRMRNKALSTFLAAAAFACCVPSEASAGGVKQRQEEKLGRGLVAMTLPEDRGVFVSWRLKVDEKTASWHVYRDGKLIRKVSAKEPTSFTDKGGRPDSRYQVRKVMDGKETETSPESWPWPEDYLEFPVKRPDGGMTPPTVAVNKKTVTDAPEGERYEYAPCEASFADLDGDGEYEVILKWKPSNQKDNAQPGFSGICYIDAYKVDWAYTGGKAENVSRLMWRIDMGRNVRAGSHYTQFLCYDFDGDGRAEVVMRTCPGTIDGQGQPVLMGSDRVTDNYMTPLAEHSKYHRCGQNLTSPEYLTVFEGVTGRQITSCAYEPERGNAEDWGDRTGNRVDRFLACAAYLDGQHPSIVMSRGYYRKAAMAAFDFDGRKLTRRWLLVSDKEGEGIFGGGNHNLSVGDVDGDGCDEIIWGSAAVDNDGTPMYNTGLGHGDAMHLGKMDPDRDGLQVWEVHEEKAKVAVYGFELHDARTGEIIWGKPTAGDNGRGLAADIDPRYPGYEMWSVGAPGTYSCKGEMISQARPPASFRCYWDGDLQDEINDGTRIYKWNGSAAKVIRKLDGAQRSNGTKSTPCCQADILGDWREELLMEVSGDPSKLRLYSTTIPTDHRVYTLMQDPQYRMSVVWQNVAYNQPPHLSFWLGAGVDKLVWRK